MIKSDIEEIRYQYENLLDIRDRFANQKDPERKRRLKWVGMKKREALDKLFEEYRSELKQLDQNDEFLHLVIDVLFVV